MKLLFATFLLTTIKCEQDGKEDKLLSKYWKKRLTVWSKAKLSEQQENQSIYYSARNCNEFQYYEKSKQSETKFTPIIFQSKRLTEKKDWAMNQMY